MKNRDLIICSNCDTNTINHKNGFCIFCYRADRKQKYNPPVPTSRFAPSEFSSTNTNKTDKSLILSRNYGFMNKLLYLTYEEIKFYDARN